MILIVQNFWTTRTFDSLGGIHVMFKDLKDGNYFFNNFFPICLNFIFPTVSVALPFRAISIIAAASSSTRIAFRLAPSTISGTGFFLPTTKAALMMTVSKASGFWLASSSSLVSANPYNMVSINHNTLLESRSLLLLSALLPRTTKV